MDNTHTCETCGKEIPTGILNISSHWAECGGKGFYESLLKMAEEKEGKLTEEDIETIRNEN